MSTTLQLKRIVSSPEKLALACNQNVTVVELLFVSKKFGSSVQLWIFNVLVPAHLYREEKDHRYV